MRTPAFAICKQQRHRSACASTQSDQCPCYWLLRQDNTSSFYIQNFKPLASFYCCAGQFESYLVGNTDDRFSRDEAHIQTTKMQIRLCISILISTFVVCGVDSVIDTISEIQGLYLVYVAAWTSFGHIWSYISKRQLFS